MLGAIKPLIIIGVIAGVIGAAIYFSSHGIYKMATEPKVCISPEQVKELCFASGIELRKCKVKKPYVVLPKGSQ